MRGKMGGQLLSGGNVHTVERIAGGVILKTRHTGNPEGLSMYTMAEDIAYEATALTDAHAIMPPHFPEVLEIESDILGSIAMRELFPDNVITLKELFAQQAPGSKLAAILATLIGRYHRLSTARADPATYRQHDFFAELLKYRYEMLGLPKLAGIVQDLLDETQHTGVIHGGLSPKNILVRASSSKRPTEKDIAFVDLETACIGSRYFDVGFNLGHLILHGIDNQVGFDELYSAYVSAYGRETGWSLDDRLLRRVVIATMLYRLLHPETKYALANIDAGISDDLYAEYIMLSEGGDDGIRT